MNSHVFFLVAGVLALVALVKLFARVNKAMGFQVSPVFTSKIAQFALERFLLRMHAFVIGQTRAVDRRIFALIALVRFFPRVQQLVLFEMGWQFAFEAAQIAHERRIAGMNYAVIPEVTLPFKSQLALVALKGFFVRMHHYVPFIKLHVIRNVVTMIALVSLPFDNFQWFAKMHHHVVAETNSVFADEIAPGALKENAFKVNHRVAFQKEGCSASVGALVAFVSSVSFTLGNLSFPFFHN